MVVWPKYLEKTKESMTTSHHPVELQKEQSELEVLQNDRMEHNAYVYPIQHTIFLNKV